MKNLLKYAWSKRSKVWKRRDVLANRCGRQAIRFQYRVAGLLVRLSRRLWPEFVSEAGAKAFDANSVRQAANPFIEYELGCFELAPAPIPTTIRETYAQCNEDIIVETLLRARCVSEGRSLSSVRYLEVGGNHPVQTSSTYLFYRAFGAQGFIVEANPALAERLRVTRPRDTVIQTAVSDKTDKTVSFYVHELDELSSLSAENIERFEASGLHGELSRVEMAPNLHINALFATYINVSLDFMSIDIEGLDLPVLRALDPKHRPKILQVECADLALLAEFVNVLEPRGYHFMAMTAVNAIFVLR
jgi:FkbM family methyltransferase